MLDFEKTRGAQLLRYFLVTGALVTVLLIGLMAYITYEPPVGGDFHLKYRGEPWDFSADAQPLNVLYIGYAKCPDVCPLTLSFAGRAFRQLSDKELSKVRMLFLSVDYENDNPDDVADYAAQFFPTFVGLSGSENDIRATVSLFQTSFILEKDESSSLGYSIIHPDRVFFLNKRGRVVTSIVSPRTADEILTVIRENL